MHASSASGSLPWNTLPAEMKLSVVELLDLKDVRSFALVCKDAYAISVPAMWRLVDIKSFDSLQSYIRNVPQSYTRNIRQLSISTKLQNGAPMPTSEQARQVTDALVELLTQCCQVEQMTLNLEGSLTKTIIPCFERFSALKILAINHCGDEQLSPFGLLSPSQQLYPL
ncbi:hypothetical protein NLI96_g10396 [Meripilus lineatus]|uniref:F-box domain-containing protein n=1 Tax=Meripilus lineatus TaxID=2056292 RepID=A0AAD5UTW1_9APHY|nr:hypothetical protein NLI96_g10396 [Physisporinus lineatus]